MWFTIYNQTTEKIRQSVNCPPECVEQICEEGEDWYLGYYPSATHVRNSTPVTEAETLTLAQVKDRKLAELAAARWSAVNGGITWNGVFINTDQEHRDGVEAIKEALVNNLCTSTQWKTGTGEWVEVTAETIVPVWNAIQVHKQACFIQEFDLARQVSLITVSDTMTEEEAIAAVNAITWSL